MKKATIAYDSATVRALDAAIAEANEAHAVLIKKGASDLAMKASAHAGALAKLKSQLKAF